MNFPFHRTRRMLEPTAGVPTNTHEVSHDIASAYNAATCRFVLDCSCGAHFDTPYIDEALEIRELHELLAPLSDALPS